MASEAQPKRTIRGRNFARYAALMASHAAKWAADCIESVEELDCPMPQESIDRFTKRMTQWLEAMNGEIRHEKALRAYLQGVSCVPVDRYDDDFNVIPHLAYVDGVVDLRKLLEACHGR